MLANMSGFMLGVLLAASPAVADCGWVLWVKSGLPGGAR